MRYSAGAAAVLFSFSLRFGDRRRGFYFVGAHTFTRPARPKSLSALGRHLKNQTTCLFGFRPPVAHVGVEDRPIYAPAYRTVACPSDMKLAQAPAAECAPFHGATFANGSSK